MPAPAATERISLELKKIALHRIAEDNLVLPSTPAVAARCLGMLREPGLNMKVLANTIERDPMLAAQVTRLANSAAYGAGLTSWGLAQSVMRLGQQRIKLLLVEACARQVFDSRDRRITEAFKSYGWCTRIRGVESGGTVEGLPTAMFPTDDGSMDAKCPTEIAISDRREGELSKAGFMALLHRKNTDQATFVGGQTVHSPARYDDSEATANANLSARLPYIFAASRFAHYLKCIVRDWVGSTREEAQLQKDLQSWIMQYVDGQPEVSSEEVKARRPLKDATIEIVPDEDNPGFYRGVFRLVPHYQFEGMDVALSMVSKLRGASK